jgi:DNA-binding MarR family transcriptional regulator
MVDSGLDVERRHQLVGLTAEFARAYLRWTDAGRCGGVSYPRLRLLEQLHCVGPDMMRVLGDQLGLTPRNMTAFVDSLEEEGLVVRRAHPSDRRAVVVELTDAGRQAAEAVLEPRIGAISELFEDLSPPEQERFLDAIQTLVDGMRRRTAKT